MPSVGGKKKTSLCLSENDDINRIMKLICKIRVDFTIKITYVNNNQRLRY